MNKELLHQSRLLDTNAAAAVEVVNAESNYPVVFVCEHASNQIPVRLHNLGLPPSSLLEHIAWDIGAEKTARLLADKLGATLILQRYSRLVIDCNRDPYCDDAIVTVSDGTSINANLDLSETAKQQRIKEIFEPFQARVKGNISRSSCKIAISIHSFTRTMQGIKRPWDIGFLFNQYQQTSTELATNLATIAPEKRIGMNQPYQIGGDIKDWFVSRQAEPSGKYHSLIEICNDQIDNEDGQHYMANLLADTIKRTVNNLL